MKTKRGSIKLTQDKKPFIMAVVLFILLIVIIFLLKLQLKGTDVECKTDADCVKQQTTCCPCNMGGTEACISKNNISQYIPKKCPEGINLICAAVYQCFIKNCKCEKGKCVAEIDEIK